ncbi:MAG: helix-turn-helix transcriptional regulator [Nostoc sp. DedSLP03]|uniref:helix-turn-helix domain-containing protein n=1 Tax=Nostoc sp. DedSLP03 TaxID=3075400 RepID=UPI002AD525E3|nr:helix-turn-helix transcriptional regulator [Nostoc sp. DedSLP03]MDZ7970500.1 helix-turn-helix transcriptional regulator [Nostoc sp. DedSLP03]
MKNEDKKPLSLDPAVLPFLQLREYLGYDRKTFAEFLGVSYDAIWQWETGRRRPGLTWNQVQKLDKIFENAGIKFKDFPYLGPPPDSPDVEENE